MLELIEQKTAVPILLENASLKLTNASSRIINVTAPGHGLTNGTTV